MKVSGRSMTLFGLLSVLALAGGQAAAIETSNRSPAQTTALDSLPWSPAEIAGHLDGFGIDVDVPTVEQFLNAPDQVRRDILTDMGVDAEALEKALADQQYGVAIAVLANALADVPPASLSQSRVMSMPAGDPDEDHLEVHDDLTTMVGGDIHAALNDHFGERAGVMGWSDDGSTYEILVVGLTQQDQQWIADNIDTQNLFEVVVYDAAVSVTELESLQERVVAAIGGDLDDFGWNIGIDMDVEAVALSIHGNHAQRTPEERAHVEAVVDRARQAAEQFETKIGATDRERRAKTSVLPHSASSAFAVELSSEFELTDWRETRPVRGGKWLRVSGGACTSGFLFKHPTTGNWRMSTAGHCSTSNGSGSTGAMVKAWNGSDIGTIRVNKFQNQGTDIALFFAPENERDAPRILRAPKHHRTVTGWRSGSNMSKGDRQCFVGLGIWRNDGTNSKCGKLKKRNVQVRLKVDGHRQTIGGMYCLERKPFGGDSGGPVYYPLNNDKADAAGSVVARKKTFYNNYYACYHTIGAVHTTTGYRLVTGK